MVGATALTVSAFGPFAYARGQGRVVIIGGGAGGGTAAHLIKKLAPKLDVTLIEINTQYTSCFFSNLVLGEFRSLASTTHNYDGLQKLGVNVIHDLATNVDTFRKTVSLRNGDKLVYDKLILSPGIDFKWNNIEGYNQEASLVMPHAWKTGEQTKILKGQLQAMKDGGLVVISAPENPFRCPPGPYERASMIAHYIKTQKPKSKLIIFDAKSKFAKMALFKEGWKEHYNNIIEWVGPEQTDGGIKEVDPKAMTVITGDGEKIKADVINIIPAQKAGIIANTAGCTDDDWCPINPEDFSSAKIKDLYVLGDASLAKSMPKSGSAANSQAKVVASSVLAELVDKKKNLGNYLNICWSLISPDNCVKYEASYEAGEKSVDLTFEFLSDLGEDDYIRAETYQDSLLWYSSIISEMFAKG